MVHHFRFRSGIQRTLLATLAAGGLLLPPAGAAPWPSWRGPRGDLTVPDENYPVRWDAGSNVRWRVGLPDRGNSSPVVWGDRVFVTQAIEATKERQLLCFQRSDGRLLWSRGLVWDKEEPSHRTNPYCSASPVTDGERVIAYFASAGILCFDLEGQELWRRDLGPQIHDFGAGVSPVLHSDLCFVYHGPGEGAYLTALNKKTGETVWRYDEPKPESGPEREDGFKGNAEGRAGTFSTPIVIQSGDREELIQSFPGHLRAFDPATGRELWSCAGLNPLVYTSPVHDQGTVVALGGFKGPGVAVQAGGSGDVTATARLWKTEMGPARLATGVTRDGNLYFFNMAGIAECLDLRTGEVVSEVRIADQGRNAPMWGSAVLVGDLLYTANQTGTVFVIKASPKFEIVSANVLDEPCNTTPAFSDGEIFIRTDKALWCLSEKDKS